MISRFLSGKTDRLGDKYIIRIARAFHVSTDFLLGESNIPDRKNYEIEERGLSVQAAKNFYTGKASSDVESARAMNRMKVPVYQADLTAIQTQFMSAVKEVKQEIGSALSAAQKETHQIAQKMFSEVTKGQGMEKAQITPEGITDAVLGIDLYHGRHHAGSIG